MPSFRTLQTTLFISYTNHGESIMLEKNSHSYAALRISDMGGLTMISSLSIWTLHDKNGGRVSKKSAPLAK
jgi:hypothetical protein